MRLGSKYLHVIKPMGKAFRAQTEIVAFAPDSHDSITSVTEPMKFHTHAHLSGDTATEVRIRIEAEVPRGLGAVAHSLTRARQKQLEGDLANLKRRLESGQL